MYLSRNHSFQRRYLALAGLFLFAQSALGEEESNPVPAPGSTGSDTAQAQQAEALPRVELPTLFVEAVNGSEMTNSGSSLAESLFGPLRTNLETPRSVSVLTDNVLSEALVRDLADLSRVSTGTDTPITFGVPSLPRIRGQEGDIFQNSLRRTGGNNGFGLPISFNPVERLDVVKGPPTVILGTARRVGGYVDFITKRPDLNDTTGTVRFEAGSYEQFRSLVDVSAVIEEGTAGIRLSWEHLDEDSFYDYAGTESDSLYLAYTRSFGTDLQWDLSAEYYEVDFTDNGGLNRPTQDLIDKGTYITGTGLSPLFNPEAFDDNGRLRPTSELQTLTLDRTPGPNAVIRPGLRVNPDGSIDEIAPEIQIDRSRVLTDPLDFSTAESLIVQSTLTASLGETTSLTNRTGFQLLEKDQVNQNSFVEIIDELYSVENRTEFPANFDFDLGGLTVSNDSVSGVAFRLHHVTAFSQFLTEADNPIDLTAAVESRRIGREAIATRLGVAPGDLGQAGLVELREGVFVSPGANYDVDGDGILDFGISDTNETDLFQVGFFHQHDFELTQQWSLLVGGRTDIFHVEGNDPLPPPGQSARSDSITEALGSVNVSLGYAPTAWSHYYVTYDFSQSVNSALGGGITLDPASGQFDETDFGIDSELIEGGAKFRLLEDTLFLAVAGYYQTRSERQRDGSTADLHTAGAEVEATYAPNDNLFALLGASYIRARFGDSDDVFQGTRRIEDAFDDSRPDIIEGTGRGSPGFTVFNTDEQFPGLPRFNLNGLFRYRHDSGIGATVSGQWESEQNLDLNGRVVIPSQFTINTGLFYRYRGFEVRFDVLNLTDEENFSPVFDGFFGADLVFPEQPRRYRFSGSYSF